MGLYNWNLRRLCCIIPNVLYDTQTTSFVDVILVHHLLGRRGIRGTQVKPSIQDIVDEVVPTKEASLWG